MKKGYDKTKTARLFFNPRMIKVVGKKFKVFPKN